MRLLELGSGISDVSAMVWRLVRDGLVRAGYKQDPLSLFTILDIEYSTPTGRTAARLLAESGRHNVTVRYGPEVGDATRLVGLEDSSFDVVWSSLMLGAFEVVRDADGVMADSPGARAVMDQAWRVARDGGVVVHTGFSYLNAPPDEYHAKTPGGKVAPWRSEPVARRWVRAKLAQAPGCISVGRSVMVLTVHPSCLFCRCGRRPGPPPPVRAAAAAAVEALARHERALHTGTSTPPSSQLQLGLLSCGLGPETQCCLWLLSRRPLTTGTGSTAATSRPGRCSGALAAATRLSRSGATAAGAPSPSEPWPAASS